MSNGNSESSSKEHDSKAPQMPTPEALCNWSTSELLEAENYLPELDVPAPYTPPSGDGEYNLRDYLEYPPTANEDLQDNNGGVQTDASEDVGVPNQDLAVTLSLSGGAESEEEEGEETSTTDGDDPDYTEFEDRKREARQDAPQPTPCTSTVAVARGSYSNMDVLMGRGGRSNHHHGNQLYLRDKTEMRQRYVCAQSKSEKTRMAEELVSRVHQRGGRFVQMIESSGDWQEVEHFVARRKASQSLREDSSSQSRQEKREKYGSTKKRRKR